jgi:Holliday junction resolvasome RuvABC DNA-binding subunit
MIATLSGKLKLREPGRLIVETAGVGYEIFVPLSTTTERRRSVRKSNWRSARLFAKTRFCSTASQASRKNTRSSC